MKHKKTIPSASGVSENLDLSFLHCVFRQPKSAALAAQSLWKWYPEATGMVVVDAGGVTPPHSNDPRVVTTLLEERMSATTNGLFLDEQTVDTFIDQVLEVCALGREWLFILEDDVRVLGPITPVLEFDLNGFNRWVRLPRRVNIELLMAFRRPLFRGYGGCGGALLRTSTLTRAPIDKVRRFLKRAIRVTKRPLGSDEVLSIWILFNRGRLGNYEGFAETHQRDYRQRLAAGEVSVVHQYKDDYASSSD